MNLVTQTKTYHFSRQFDRVFLDFLCQNLVVQFCERVLLLEHEIGNDRRDLFRHQIGQVVLHQQLCYDQLALRDQTGHFALHRQHVLVVQLAELIQNRHCCGSRAETADSSSSGFSTSCSGSFPG